MLNTLLEESAAAFPNKDALIINQQRVTYVQLHELANSLAASFLAANIKKGHRIAFLLPNSLELILCYYACFTMGAIAVPININFDNTMVNSVLKYCKPRVLITNEQFYQRLLKNNLLNDIKRCYLTTGSHKHPETRDFKKLLIKAPSVDFPQVLSDNPALIYYTSGTTGLPKAVLHTHRTLMKGTKNQMAQIQMSTKDTTLVLFPLCYLIGLGSQILPFHCVGATVVVLAEFEAKAALESIIKNKITKIYGFPKLYLELVNQANSSCKNNVLDFCFSGGEAIPPALQEQFRSVFNIEITEGCGMSELQIYCMNPPYGEKKIGSIGFPIAGIDMQLIDENKSPIATAHTIGEIIVQSGSMTPGYWQNDTLTTQTIKNGWFYTGDLAYRDEDGWYWFVSRKVDIIKRANLLISPLEIEHVFYQHPAIKEAAAVALPKRKEANDELIVFVLLRADSTHITRELLMNFANELLPKGKQPDYINLVNELPYGVTGKIDRKELKKWAEKYQSK